MENFSHLNTGQSRTPKELQEIRNLRKISDGELVKGGADVTGESKTYATGEILATKDQKENADIERDVGVDLLTFLVPDSRYFREVLETVALGAGLVTHKVSDRYSEQVDSIIIEKGEKVMSTHSPLPGAPNKSLYVYNPNTKSLRQVYLPVKDIGGKKIKLEKPQILLE